MSDDRMPTSVSFETRCATHMMFLSLEQSINFGEEIVWQKILAHRNPKIPSNDANVHVSFETRCCATHMMFL